MKTASRFTWWCGAYPKKDILLLMPALLGFFTFYLLPFVWSVHYALSDSVFTQSFVGFTNFRKTWNNAYYHVVLPHSRKLPRGNF
jgi:multiple sugar transport system permease protein